jgi:hypothetical protein
MKIHAKQVVTSGELAGTEYTVILPGKEIESCEACDFYTTNCNGVHCTDGRYGFALNTHDDGEIKAKLTVMRMEGKL